MALRKYEYVAPAKPVVLFDITPRGLVFTADGISKATELLPGFDKIVNAELYWDDEDPRIVVVPAATSNKSTFAVKTNSKTFKRTINISKLLGFASIPGDRVSVGAQELTVEDSIGGISVPVAVKEAKSENRRTEGTDGNAEDENLPKKRWLLLKDRDGRSFYAHPETKALLFYKDGSGKARPSKEIEERILAAVKAIDDKSGSRA